MQTLGNIVHDLLICLLVGLLVGVGVALVLFLIGLMVCGFDPLAALVVVRGGLLITGALELLVCAGLMLSRKDGRKVQNYGMWRRNFRIFGLLPVLMATSSVILTLGSIVDYYLYF